MERIDENDENDDDAPKFGDDGGNYQ